MNFGKKLKKLRTEAGYTQAELAEKINYSDKSVSKWERAEALPDVLVVKSMADLFGVTVDFMLTSHDQWVPVPTKTSVSTGTITTVVQLGIWTAAVLLFNMTMPITLWGAARLMPGGKGFAFGLLTFGLFLGFLPTWLGWPSILTSPWAMALAAVVSAVILLAGLKGERVEC